MAVEFVPGPEEVITVFTEPSRSEAVQFSERIAVVVEPVQETGLITGTSSEITVSKDTEVVQVVENEPVYTIIHRQPAES